MAAALRVRSLTAIALAGLCLLTAGCLTERQEAVLSMYPRNQVFGPDSGVLPLEAGQTHVFAEFDRLPEQNVVILRLARNAQLQKRFHYKHDVVILCVSGRAIFLVEDVRHPAGPGTLVVVPRMTAYSIIPNDPASDFSAALVFSPPYEGGDTYLAD
jgi:hypothetical protein